MLALLLSICIPADTLIPLREVVIKQPTENAIGSVEQHLSKNPSLQWIRRGNYAAEPLLNGLSSERNLITLDGMRIYSACTDKMDPITSYLEITQLESTHIGSANGPNIGGGLDLQQRKTGFGKQAPKGIIFGGYEGNHRHRMMGFQFSTGQNKWYADLNISHRKAENYRAARDSTILYSGFKKSNVSVQLGYKTRSKDEWEAGYLYDLARQVGYPALPMDVGKAEGNISFLQYTRHFSASHWKTRVYYNRILHRMDDSQRPDVPVRMDMPGWSNTSGIHSEIKGNGRKKALKVTFNAHSNYSLAEMTMFAPGEKDMFMLTWPGVRTTEFDLHVEDVFPISSTLNLLGGAGFSAQSQRRRKDFGGLDIFFPEARENRSHLLSRVSGGIHFQQGAIKTALHLNFSERAPSVSEAFGFYLFNSGDKFDYIGNPTLRKEKGHRLQWLGAFRTSKFKTETEVTAFFLHDYILGLYDPSLSAMTIGATGVKIYRNLPGATLYRVRWEGNLAATKDIFLKISAFRQWGAARDYGNLPYMQPFTVRSSLRWDTQHFGVECSMEAAEKQKHVDAAAAERPSSAYAIMHLQASTQQGPFQVRAGIENLWDALYSTYADWNKIPRMGRNVFFNVVWNF